MEKTQKWKSQFMIVALGQAVSMLGSHGVQFALIWWLAEKTSSPLMLGISGLVAYLPMTLFSRWLELRLTVITENLSLFFRIWQWVQLH